MFNSTNEKSNWIVELNVYKFCFNIIPLNYDINKSYTMRDNNIRSPISLYNPYLIVEIDQFIAIHIDDRRFEKILVILIN